MDIKVKPVYSVIINENELLKINYNIKRSLTSWTNEVSRILFPPPKSLFVCEGVFSKSLSVSEVSLRQRSETS